MSERKDVTVNGFQTLHNFPCTVTKLLYCIFNGAVNNLQLMKNDAFCTQNVRSSSLPSMKRLPGIKVSEDMAEI